MDQLELKEISPSQAQFLRRPSHKAITRSSGVKLHAPGFNCVVMATEEGSTFDPWSVVNHRLTKAGYSTVNVKDCTSLNGTGEGELFLQVFSLS